MAIFEEKQMNPCVAVLVLCAVLVLSFPFWHLGDRELFQEEGSVAAAISEMTAFPPAMTIHGKLSSDQYPLYPLICKYFRAISGCSMEFSLRFVSIFFLAMLTILVGFNCYRSDGIQAAAAAGAVMLTSFISLEKTMAGYPHTLTALILYAGWLLWIYFPLERGRWDLAWLSAGLFSGLAFYSAGITGVVFFLVPLFLQGRPLNMHKKMACPSFFAAAGILLFFILLWFVPRWQYEDLFNFTEYAFRRSFTSVLRQYAVFPFRFMMYLFPWILMLWAPFCDALKELDRNPLLSRYLKRLFAVLFLLIWLNPHAGSRDILYLTPLAASMVGLNYWIVVRRYGYRFLWLFAVLSMLLCVLALLAETYLLLPDSWLKGVQGFLNPDQGISYNRKEMPYFAFSLAEGGAAFALGIAGVVLCRRGKAVWLTYCVIFTGLMLLFSSVVNPYFAQIHPKAELARKIRWSLDKEDVLPEDMVLYKDSEIDGLFSESYYMKNYRVRTIDMRDLQDEPDTVYVLTTNIPLGGNRNWGRISDEFYMEKHLYLYKGVRVKKEVQDEE